MARIRIYDIRTLAGAYVGTCKTGSPEAAIAYGIGLTQQPAENLVATTRVPATKYEAHFSDGVVEKRSSHREYSHAWRYGRGVGFSSRLDLAQSEINKRLGWSRARGGTNTVFYEIVPVIIVKKGGA